MRVRRLKGEVGVGIFVLSPAFRPQTSRKIPPSFGLARPAPAIGARRGGRSPTSQTEEGWRPESKELPHDLEGFFSSAFSTNSLELVPKMWKF